MIRCYFYLLVFIENFFGFLDHLNLVTGPLDVCLFVFVVMGVVLFVVILAGVVDVDCVAWVVGVVGVTGVALHGVVLIHDSNQCRHFGRLAVHCTFVLNHILIFSEPDFQNLPILLKYWVVCFSKNR